METPGHTYLMSDISRSYRLTFHIFVINKNLFCGDSYSNSLYIKQPSIHAFLLFCFTLERNTQGDI